MREREELWGPGAVFSPTEPAVRLVWDATTLSAYMADPLSYYWKHVRGFRSDEESVTLLFGQLYDQAVKELWDREPLASVVLETVRRAEAVCLDEVVAEAKPSQARGRRTRDLVRAIVWYADEVLERDRFETTVLEQEVMLWYPISLPHVSREPFFYVGRLDALVRDNESGVLAAVERKTTNMTITGPGYWQQWRTSLQVWGYDWLLEKNGYVDPGMRGHVVVEACQTGATMARFEEEVMIRTPEQRQEAAATLEYWIARATLDARTATWMPNPTLRFPGDFGARLAAMSPESRELRLPSQGDISGRVWSPLTGKRDWVVSGDLEEGE